MSPMQTSCKVSHFTVTVHHGSRAPLNSDLEDAPATWMSLIDHLNLHGRAPHLEIGVSFYFMVRYRYWYVGNALNI